MSDRLLAELKERFRLHAVTATQALLISEAPTVLAACAAIALHSEELSQLQPPHRLAVQEPAEDSIRRDDLRDPDGQNLREESRELHRTISSIDLLLKVTVELYPERRAS